MLCEESADTFETSLVGCGRVRHLSHELFGCILQLRAIDAEIRHARCHGLIPLELVSFELGRVITKVLVFVKDLQFSMSLGLYLFPPVSALADLRIS